MKQKKRLIYFCISILLVGILSYLSSGKAFAASTVTVTYDAGDGVFSGTETSTKSYNVSSGTSLYGYDPGLPDKEGYAFAGWFVPGKSTEGDASTYLKRYYLSSFNVTEDITLEARYTSDYTTVTFDATADGYFGNDEDNRYTAYKIPKDQKIYFSFAPSTPSVDKPKYKNESKSFKHWITPGDETKISQSGYWMYSYSEDTTFEAFYADRHVVTFDAGDGGYYKDGTEQKDIYTKLYDDNGFMYSYDFPSIYNSDTSLYFAGYHITEPSGYDDIYSKYEIVQIFDRVTQDITLEAVWLDPEADADQLATLTFEAGEHGKLSKSSYTILKGKSLKSVYDMYGVTPSAQDDMVFTGWIIEGDSSGTSYS